jgi:hypothetical protein
MLMDTGPPVLTWTVLDVTSVPGAIPLWGVNENGDTCAQPASGAHSAHRRAHRLRFRHMPGESDFVNVSIV